MIYYKNLDWAWLLFSTKGRAARFDYWVGYFMPAFIIGTLLAFIDSQTGFVTSQGVGISALIFQFLSYIPHFIVLTKRWHDRGKSGWMNLVILIPFVGALWILIECGLMRGQKGPNRYGLPRRLELI